MSLRERAVEAMAGGIAKVHGGPTDDRIVADVALEALLFFLSVNIQEWCDASDDPMMDRDYPRSLLDVLRGSTQ